MATPRPKPPAMRRRSATTRRKPATARRPGPRWAGERADYGKPIDAFFHRQPPHLRAVLVALRSLVEAAAPDATSSIKWGMPFYCIDERMFCALGGHKAHVNLIMVGPPEGFSDPQGRLEGTGRGGRHLKLASLDELPRAAVRRWLRTAVAWARR